MKATILFGLALLTGCAYGQAPEPEQQYGHTNPYDGGSGTPNPNSDWGSGSGTDGVPFGCVMENAYENGQLIFSGVFCPSDPQMAFKWLVDPPPMHDKEKQ